MTQTAVIRPGWLLGTALALAVTACDVGDPEPVADDDDVGYSVELPTFFDYPGFGGDSFTIGGTTEFVGFDWNDRISAVLVPDGATLVLYQHAGFGGDHLVLVAPGVVNLADFGFNDGVSSIEVHGLCTVGDAWCEGDTVVTCQDGHRQSRRVCPVSDYYATTCVDYGDEWVLCE